MEETQQNNIKKFKELLKESPLTDQEITKSGVDSTGKGFLNHAYNDEEIHLAPLRDQNLFYLDGEKNQVIEKLMRMKRAGGVSDRDLQIFNTIEELVKKYNIKEDADRLRGKTIENYLLYKRRNKKKMNTISRDKVREIVEGSFLLATKMLYIPVPRTRSSAYKEVLSKIGGSLPSRPSFHIQGLVKQVKGELNLSDEEAGKLKMETQDIAKQFEDNALRYVGKNDLAVAGAYIYVALKRQRDLPEITQRQVAEISGTTVPTIVEHVRDIRGLLERKRIIK